MPSPWRPNTALDVRVLDHQVIRHRLTDRRIRIESTRAWPDAVTLRAETNDKDTEWMAQVCLLKNHAMRTMQFCADAAVQILGGTGFMQGTAAERIYREVKAMMIGGGTEEIMK